MLRLITIAATLYVYWLLLSGHYAAWLVAAGAILSVVIVIFCWSKGVIDREGFPVEYSARGLTYWPWLLWQILLSGLRVSRLVIDPKLPISPTLARVQVEPESSVGLVTYANSITLTPGTISIEASERGRTIWVHAIEQQGADFEDDEMNRRVARFDGTVH